jgi:uncharacterized protein YbaP (TraB family)
VSCPVHKWLPVLALLLAGSPAFAAENGHPLPMWQIDGASNSIYLLGSIHMLREKDHPIPSAIYDAYAQAETLIMEIDMDDIDPVADQALATDLGLIQDGRALADLMGPELYAEAESLAEALQIPLRLLEKSEPWYAAINVEMMMLMRIGFNPTHGIEFHLAEIASRDNKEIFGLETTRQQLEILDRLSLPSQRDLLIQTLSDSAELSQAMDEMVDAWRYGDVEFLEKSLLADMQEFDELHQAIVVNRNRNWVVRIEDLLREKDDYLIIVGALHLVGDQGVPNLLSQRGFDVIQLHQPPN